MIDADERIYATIPLRIALEVFGTVGRALGTLCPAALTWLMRCIVDPLTATVCRAMYRKKLSYGAAHGCPVPGEWISLRGAGRGHSTSTGKEAVIVFAPGGGFVLRSGTAIPFALAVLPRLARQLSEGTGVPSILVVNYPLPACASRTPLEIDAVITWLAKSNRRAIVCGDSAGGLLALQAILRSARHKSVASSPSSSDFEPLGAVAICPVIDLTLSSPSVEANRYSDMLSARWLRVGYNIYANDRRTPGGSHEEALRQASILFYPDLTAFVDRKVLIVTGERDLLRDESFAFAKKAPPGAVDLIEVQDGALGMHDFMLFLRSPQTDKVFDAVASYISSRIAQS